MAQQTPLVIINGQVQRLPSGDTISGASGMSFTPIKTANYTAAANEVVRLNSTNASFTVTLPTSPADGTMVGVFDVANKCGTYPVLISPEGKMLEGDLNGLSVNMNGAYVQLIYNAATTNWKIADTYANSYNVKQEMLSPFLLMGG